MCLWNTAPGGNKVQKNYFQHKGQSEGHKVIDFGVIWKGIITLCSKSPSVWGFVACLPFRLLLISM